MEVNSTHCSPSLDSTTDLQLTSVRVEPPTELPEYFWRKAMATRVLGGMLLVVASPIILLLMALVRLTSAGPGLYRQTRVGRGGRDFTLFKIRTMIQDAESTTGPIWCQMDDSRITPVGKFLRLLHLDELPQLINIVRGEMDLIGPRPERPTIVEKLVSQMPDYAERIAVLPGVTGLAQINLPPDETIDCVRRKLVLDLEYIRTAGFQLDVRILLCTALRMVNIRHGYAVRLFRLHRPYPKVERRYAHQPAASSPLPTNSHAATSPRLADSHNNQNALEVSDTVALNEQEVAGTATVNNDPRSIAPRDPK